MIYTSTRSDVECTAKEAVIKGIAPDGGLFVTRELPELDVEKVLDMPYAKMAETIMDAMLPGYDMEDIVKVYSRKFDDPEITPLKKVGENYCLELWHGPTSAFKDLALSVLPRFITDASDGETVRILTATSGDTGKAALEGFHDVEGTEITVFFPDGGVSEMQKLQMVTQEGKNVKVAAVRGNFDDCQKGVKEAFAVHPELSSANSINIGRLVPQIVYYFSAYSQLMKTGEIRFGDEVDFIVPTGNFGDIFAGRLASYLGLPVGMLVCASNSNNILFDFITTGVYDKRREFLKTTSPSMDILVSSNLERELYYLCDGDTEYVKSLMKQLNENGYYRISEEYLESLQYHFAASYCTEEENATAIKETWEKYSYLIDTHTACGFNALGKIGSENKRVVLSTASPFKFPEAVSKALGCENITEYTGIEPPANLVDLDKKPVLHKDVINKEDIAEYAYSMS